ncbi:MAG TPA: ATP-binding cassette domain-containing protein [Candidatus Dormibacteraeota bacterium]|nr:ATP-binding cassette domain-containing protein [Candidatus Dormibacteraeota bacterium]
MLVAEFEVTRRAFTVRMDIQVEPGERLAVLGPSGAGKTTFLEAVAGLVPLTAGEIRLDQRQLSSAARPQSDVPVGRRGVGLLRQNPGLFPHLTVLENICYPAGASAETATAAAARMGLHGLLQTRPQGLSGGEAQRVALCRTLQTTVRLLCLDEPFSSLDRPLGLELLGVLGEELRSRGMAALLVTHQLQEAQAFADRVAVLAKGSVLQVGGPRELVLRPKTAVVASLVGYRGWLRRGEQLLAIHPDRIWPAGSAATAGALSGRVVGMKPDGARIDVELESLGDWLGRFHCSFEEPPALGSEHSFRAEAAPVFAGSAAVFD